ncbi:alpha-L-fucosidase [Murimonas intestini]|nr:alpha-L-fucosidase [Murimonas intestini]
MKLLSKNEYAVQIANTRDARMKWWREARFGMFVHFGLYSVLGRNEWVQACENIPQDEYEKLADSFQPIEGCCREWAKLAKEAGMKYMVLTTRHHEGFSLWDSKTNPFNSVNYGCHRDIVKEFVDACHEYGLKIGFYSSLMDWHHPDSWKCAFDTEARKRFTEYIEALNTELLTKYGKIDLLWYDVSSPMESWEGWDSLARNQRLRALQPDIIINDRSKLEEDFGTPEGAVESQTRDWEACMTFNDISWGYLDAKQAEPYAYNAQRIIRMVNICTREGGNLLLNIGPAPDGSVPEDAWEPLRQTGKWLSQNEAAVYGIHKKIVDGFPARGNGVTFSSQSEDGRHIYLWNYIWPSNGEMGVGGYFNSPRSVKVLSTGEEIPFVYDEKNQRIRLYGLPKTSPDKVAGVAVLDMEFEEEPEYHSFSILPQLNGGRVFE